MEGVEGVEWIGMEWRWVGGGGGGGGGIVFGVNKLPVL